jgi:hypothetical protein
VSPSRSTGDFSRQHTPYRCQILNHGLCASIASCLRLAAKMSFAFTGLVSGAAKMCSSRSISAIVCSVSIRTISNRRAQRSIWGQWAILKNIQLGLYCTVGETTNMGLTVGAVPTNSRQPTEYRSSGYDLLRQNSILNEWFECRSYLCLELFLPSGDGFG